MGDFISNLIKLLLKMILLLVVLYVGFVVVVMIVRDFEGRFLNEGEQTEVVADSVAVADAPTPEVAPTPKVKVKSTKKEKPSPATMFDEPRGCVTSNNLKVEIILDGKYVIAEELDPVWESRGYQMTTDLTVVFIDEDNTYYTDQIVKILKGKCARQIGVYKSDHYLYDDKTLPIVEIMNK